MALICSEREKVEHRNRNEARFSLGDEEPWAKTFPWTKCHINIELGLFFYFFSELSVRVRARGEAAVNFRKEKK